MFSNKKPDPVPVVNVGSDRPFDSPSMSMPRSTYEAPRGGSTGGHSIVDECLTMRGDLESDGDVMVKGRVYGNIKCKVLIIDVNALVEGGVEAEEIIVRGASKGTVRATRVRLEKSAVVESDIFHQTFSAEEGARIKGALRYKDDPLAADATETAPARANRTGKTGNGNGTAMSMVSTEVIG